jgi:hypothetical protein
MHVTKLCNTLLLWNNINRQDCEFNEAGAIRQTAVQDNRDV